MLRLLAVFLLPSILGAGPLEDFLKPEPRWHRLEAFQHSLQRGEFERALDQVYAPNADWRQWIELDETGAWIVVGDETDSERIRLWFAPDTATSSSPTVGRKPLRGLRIALDPGHLGGVWGPMEERSFLEGEGALVQEGDLTLAACQLAAEKLEELGATVALTRSNAEPVTELRPADFREVASDRLDGLAFEGIEREQALQLLSEKLFYRTAEIRARAEWVERWSPDLVVALHINASDPENPEISMLHQNNDAHILVNGCYLRGELADPGQRFELLWRLLNRYHEEERELAFAMKRAMREATSLPPYRYRGKNARSLDVDGYIYARNLLANRVFDCPVVYLEPWQANSVEVYEWAAAGHYEGEREFSGKRLRSLPAVYADFVVQGLLYRYGK